jgi:hypothetical protein
MTRKVSPAFAAIAIIVALALGALYFFARLRAHEAREADIARMLRQQRDAAIRSGRYQQGLQRGRAGSRRGPGAAERPQAESAPGEESAPAGEADEE